MGDSVRVLIVSSIFWPEYAGWLQQTLTMIQACDPTQLSFTWISPYVSDQPRVEEWCNLTVRRIGSHPRGSARVERVAFGVDVLNYLYKNQDTYDLIYCPLSYTPTEIVSAAARLLQKPVVVRVAQGELSVNHIGGRIRRWLLPRLADGLVVLNQGHGLSRPNVHWHPNGVDTGRFHPPSTDERAAARQRWQFSDGVQVILFVGSIVVRKGVDTLLSAFYQIQQSNPDCILVLAGPLDITEGARGIQAEFIAKLKATTQVHGVESRVRFLGRVSDIPSLLHAADIFVLPSLAEGMPNALLEAMASGLPCIATNIPGIREVIDDEVDGYQFTPGHITQLAGLLNKLLNYPEQRAMLALQGRAKIEQHYSIQKTAQRYQVLFERLVNSQHHAT
jgi:glycosyltransferase involved in cell wall biosynthesis